MKIYHPPDWHTGHNPDALLNIIRQRAAPSEYQPPRLPPEVARRLQLFACACARMVWDLLPTDARSAVLIRERFADGRATEVDVRASAVRRASPGATYQQHALCAVTADPHEAARNAAKALATRAAGPAPAGGSPVPKAWQVAWNRVFLQGRGHQAELVRDIFPPPGYTPHLPPEVLTDTVRALARQMDESGDFSLVPILADALQDAGCADEVALARCRAPSGAHARGNWVVDSVLGRA